MLRVAQFSPINQLNPVVAEEGFAAEAPYLVFDQLVCPGADGKPVGCLLEGWEFRQNGRILIATLRSGIRFHDGSPVTSDDLIFTFEAIRELGKESPYSSVLDDVSRIEKMDERSVSIHLKHPYWRFPESLDFGVLPARLLRNEKVATSAFNHRPIGAGPFRVSKMENGALELERNRDYYGSPPGLDRITVRAFDSDELWRRLLARHIDAALFIPWSKHRFLNHLSTIRTDKSTREFATGLCFNRARRPFNRAAARKAFAAAIDRERLVRDTEFGFGVATERLDPAEVPTARFDVEAARRELGGRTIHISVIGNSSHQLDVAMELQRQLSAADLTLQIDLDANRLQSDVAFCGFLDPRPLESAASKYGSTLNPEYKDIDAIFDRIAETKDEVTRHTLFQTVEDRLLEDEPLAILFWQPSFSAYRAEYCGYHMVNLFDGLEKMRPCP